MIVLGCWKTGTEQIVETSDPVVGCLCIGWLFGWWGMSDVAIGRLEDEESWLYGWLFFAWIDVVLSGSSFLLLWGSIMVVLSSQHLRCEMSGQFVLHHYFESDEHERENVLHNDCWVLDEGREECHRFSSQHSPLDPVGSVVSSFDSFRSPCPSLVSGFRLVRVVVCSPDSCSSPCRVQVSPTICNWCNRGCWPLLWPFRRCRHRSCRCSISGNYRTRASTTPPVARVLADPDGSSTSAIPVSVLRSSCKCLEVVSISLF